MKKRVIGRGKMVIGHENSMNIVNSIFGILLTKITKITKITKTVKTYNSCVNHERFISNLCVCEQFF